YEFGSGHGDDLALQANQPGAAWRVGARNPARNTCAAAATEHAAAPARRVQGKLRGKCENRGRYAAEDTGASRKSDMFRMPQSDGPDRLRDGEFRLEGP